MTTSAGGTVEVDMNSSANNLLEPAKGFKMKVFPHPSLVVDLPQCIAARHTSQKDLDRFWLGLG